MALRDEVRDPWVYILAGLGGGVAWAVGVPLAAAAGVAITVGGVRAGLGAVLSGRSGPRTRSGDDLPITDHSPEQEWLDRGDAAVATFRDLARSLPEGLASSHSASIATQADETLAGMRRLAGQASVTTKVSGRLHVPTLKSEEERLRFQRDAATDADIAAELERSLDSIGEQVDIAQRLERSRATLLVRLESSALGLERLVAQLAEILAMSEGATSPIEGAKQLEALADDLEGLRAGLAETEQLSRRALSAYEGEGSVGHATGEDGRDS
jgi:hypothetical protein